MATTPLYTQKNKKVSVFNKSILLKSWDLYLLLLPVTLYFLVFRYLPLYGIQIAFKNFIASSGIFKSPWAGLTHFERFFSSFYFWRLIKNTLGISLYQLAVGFPIPIVFAIMINEVRNKFYKKTLQLVSYAPHFISTVVLVGIVIAFLSPRNGIVNQIIVLMGGNPINFIAEPAYFKTIYVLSGVWQNTGWNSIIYLAALISIDQSQYEAAIVDGADRFRRIWHISLPGVIPTAVILLILNTGRIVNVGFEKVFLLQNQINMEASDVITTYVYRVGLLGADFSFSSAVGLFNSVVNFTLLIIVNKLAKHLNETSLW